MPSVSIPSLITAGVSAAGTIGSAIIGGNAASSAASDQAAAAQAAQQTQLQMFNTVQKNLEPYNTAGQGALSQLANIFGFGPGGAGQPNASAATSQLTQFPGYQFGLDQGTQALDRSAASRGLLLSGAQLKDSQAYGQGYAQQQAWAPYVSELNNVSTLGENAAGGIGTAAVNTGSGVAGSQLAQGYYTGAGTVAGANALTGGINQLTSSLSPYLSSYGGVGGASPGGFSGSTLGGLPSGSFGDLSGYTGF